MIEINLLPENMRKAEATPLPRFLAMCVGIVCICALVWLNAKFVYKDIPAKDKQIKEMKAQLKDLKTQAKVLAELEDQVARRKDHIEKISDLYRKRVVWAKLLWDLKQIFNFDETMNKSNPERRYLWFTSFKLGGVEKRTQARKISLSTYAAAPDTDEGSKIVAAIIAELRNYKVKNLPEVQKRKELEDHIKKLELKRRQDTEKLKQAELVEKSQEQVNVEAELAALAKKSSGKIAKKSFPDFMHPGSIVPVKVSWGGSTKPTPDFRPMGRHSVPISMQLLPPPKAPVVAKKKKKRR